jgi:radical SAM protein with 4Fe4S-binding SPASM domain
MSGPARVTPLATDRSPGHLPIGLQVEFTSDCNLRCRMCPLTTGTSSSSGSPGPMRDAVFEELLDIAKRCGHVILAGYGEPLSNPRCIELLMALEAAAVDIVMATNGLLITPIIAEQLVAITTLRLINFSIDSPDPAVYREVRRGSLRRALRGLEHVMSVIDDPERVMVSAVAMDPTLPTLSRFPEILSAMGVRRFEVQAVMDYNQYAATNGLLDRTDLAPLLDVIATQCRTHHVRLELSVPERSEADLRDPAWARTRFYGSGEWDENVTRQCNVPWDIPFIDKDGGVYACCFAASADERRLGQLGPQTFDEIWEGVAFRRFRNDILDGATTPAICRRCTVAPLGPHPFRTWAATVIAGDARITSPTAAIVTIIVRNDGAREWTAADHVRVGTAGPRDQPSALAHREWISPNRAATFSEASVPPASTATFTFPLRRLPGRSTTQIFEIVADGSFWIPHSAFSVEIPGDPRPWRSLLESGSRVIRRVLRKAKHFARGPSS